jgi:hypothetical protein
MKKNAENAEEFSCKTCDFRCCKLSDWTRHTLTRKHQNRTNLNEKNAENATAAFTCKKCNKTYKARNSLWYHENKCAAHPGIEPVIVNQIISELRNQHDNVELRNFIVEQSKITADIITRTIDKVMEHNAEIMSKALESCKPVHNNTVNNNNSNNKFNINVFLNEQCKDALNFNEFVKNIEISYQDLENNAQLGFVQGISKIFMDNLKQLGVNERPIHCTDIKRETMYIKDEDKWTKETDDSKLQKAIQTVSYKSMGKLMEWKQENPEYQDADSEFSKKCMDIQRQSLAGSERDVYYPKVIHVLAKETMVDK